MKIKDIKGIADKLPKKQTSYEVNRIIGKKVVKETIPIISTPYNQGIEECLSTDIDLQDIVEIDVEETIDTIYDTLGKRYRHYFEEGRNGNKAMNNMAVLIVQAITKSGCIRWKEEQNG